MFWALLCAPQKKHLTKSVADKCLSNSRMKGEALFREEQGFPLQSAD